MFNVCVLYLTILHFAVCLDEVKTPFIIKMCFPGGRCNYSLRLHSLINLYINEYKQNIPRSTSFPSNMLKAVILEH